MHGRKSSEVHRIEYLHITRFTLQIWVSELPFWNFNDSSDSQDAKALSWGISKEQPGGTMDASTVFVSKIPWSLSLPPLGAGTWKRGCQAMHLKEGWWLGMTTQNRASKDLQNWSTMIIWSVKECLTQTTLTLSAIKPSWLLSWAIAIAKIEIFEMVEDGHDLVPEQKWI